MTMNNCMLSKITMNNQNIFSMVHVSLSVRTIKKD